MNIWVRFRNWFWHVKLVPVQVTISDSMHHRTRTTYYRVRTHHHHRH